MSSFDIDNDEGQVGVFRAAGVDTGEPEGEATNRFPWKILLMGQGLSFLLACTGAIQSALYLDCNLSAPSFSVGLYYLTLAACLIPLFRPKYQPTSSEEHEDDRINNDDNDEDVTRNLPQYSFFFGRLPLYGPPWLYLGMAFLDVYANYFTVLAFKYTTITSVTLFDALAIPSAMAFSRLFLMRQYRKLHFVGVVVAMIGVVINLFLDYQDDVSDGESNNLNSTSLHRLLTNSDTDYYPHKVRGDILAIAGGLMFGANDVLAEAVVRKLGGTHEYLGMLGFFASIICAVQTLATEMDDVAEFFAATTSASSKTCKGSVAWLQLIGFVICSSIGYFGGARFLQISEATFFNLSLLTGDLWSVIFSVFAERIIPPPAFFVALTITVTGVVLYERAPSPVVEKSIRQEQQVGCIAGQAMQTEDVSLSSN